MAVKIKFNLKRLHPHRKGNIIETATILYLDEAAKYLKKQIPKEMDKGKSPVEGGRWDVPYSDSYQKAIRRNGWFGKKPTPINLRISGALHDSLNIRRWGKRLLVRFMDKLADIHNKKGAGKKKAIRRMLPTKDGEEWNVTIRKGLDKIAKRTAKKITSKLR